jgi:hypothetical protein
LQKQAVNPMLLVPTKRVELATILVPKEVMDRLRGSFPITSNLLWALITAPQGTLIAISKTNSFWMTQQVTYGNSYLAFGRAKVVYTDHGSKVRILFFAPFSSLVFLLFGAGTYLVFWGTQPRVALIVWAGMFVLVHLISCYLFFREVRAMERSIIQALATPTVPPENS